MVAIVAATTSFTYVEEKEVFLALFSHRYDFIYASHPNPKEKPDWRSEKRYPLSDRQLLEGNYLYGVRFAQQTQYFLLDIDRSSPYHPQNSPLVLERLYTALEPLGLTDHIVCTSSDSQGLHLYFPLAQDFNSWKLSKAVSIALENAGFKLKLGQLEIFPNPKAYSTDQTPSLFNAHRLPLQMGSYVLDDDLEHSNSSHINFVRMWRLCQRRNSLNTRRVRILLKKAKQVSYQLSNQASKFLDDLNTEIETGWTAHGQTNRLLGRITMRSFIFNHIVEGGDPLEGNALVQKIASVAKALPGYKDWCRHQHEIEERAIEWARCIENSHYFAYGSAKGRYKKPTTTTQVDNELDYNQQQAQATQAKIVDAVRELEHEGTLPERATARFKKLLTYNIGGASLYRYRQLWHPIELENLESETQNTDIEDACTKGANALNTPVSLLPAEDSNVPLQQALSDSDTSIEPKGGSNSSDTAQAIRDRIKQQLAAAQKARAAALLDPVPMVDEVAIAIHRRALQRMREFLLSGEPILLAEVGRWLAKQPLPIRDELIRADDEQLQELLNDLATISLYLVQQQRSPWQVRKTLEENFGKSTLLELTPHERQVWISILSRYNE